MNIVEEVFNKQSNGRFLGKCPFHAEKTPSCIYAPDKDRFFCFGCGKQGTGEELAEALNDPTAKVLALMEKQQKDFDQIVLDDYGVTLHWSEWPYDIAWEQIDTPLLLLGLVRHLLAKAWVDKDQIETLILKIGQHKGWHIYP